MADEQSKDLRKEIKTFINTTNFLIEKIQIENKNLEEQELLPFAETIHKLNHFSIKMLNSKNPQETYTENANIIKNLTESSISLDDTSSESCSLIGAADLLKNEHQASKIRTIIKNLALDQKSSEVLFDDLMVIYKELAA